jgi:rhodanese-related sulfurtransferase
MEGRKIFFIFRIIGILIITMFLTGIIFLAGCNEVPAKKEAVQISVEKVAEILKTQKSSYIILDVRTKEEFDAGHLDSAVLIPVDELESRFGELSKKIPIIVYCRSGRRSAKATGILVGKGFSPVYDMTGGINAWTTKGYPVFVENPGSGAAEITIPASNQSDSQGSAQDTENVSSAGETLAGDTSAGETSAIVGVGYISADELNTKVTNGEDIVILDVRSEDSYTAKHIKNAINIPFTDFEGRIGELDSSKEIIIYCSNNDCGLSANAVTMLKNSGFKNVFALEGGIESWQYNGYPVE